MGLQQRAVGEIDESELYPCYDGVPMDDNQHPLIARVAAEVLAFWYEAQGRSAYIGTDNAIYYQLGDPRKVVGPDFFVIEDVPDDPDRDCWRIWNEDNRLPVVIVELVSKTRKSIKKDYETNFRIYQDTLHTPFYFVYSNRRRKFQGFRLHNGKYVPIVPNKAGWLWCDALDLYLGVDGIFLRWYDKNGHRLPTPAEAEAARVHEEAQRANEEAQRANLEAQRANQETQRANQEAQRARAAEEELSRLRAEIERLRGS